MSAVDTYFIVYPLPEYETERKAGTIFHIYRVPLPLFLLLHRL